MWKRTFSIKSALLISYTFSWNVTQLFPESLKENSWNDDMQLSLIESLRSLKATVPKCWYHSNCHCHSVKHTGFLQQHRKERWDFVSLPITVIGLFTVLNTRTLLFFNIWIWINIICLFSCFFNYVKTQQILPLKIMLIHTCIMEAINPFQYSEMDDFYNNEKADTVRQQLRILTFFVCQFPLSWLRLKLKPELCEWLDWNILLFKVNRVLQSLPVLQILRL